MLSKVFNQQTLSILTVVFSLITIGCSSKTVDLARSQDHPANPNAQQGTAADHHNMPMANMHEGDAGHSITVLSPEGASALGAMLDAYLAIGNQLASDTMDGVNAKAHVMIEAFHTVKGEVPDELWNAHETHTKKIHDTAHELNDLSDIKVARIAYGSLSDSFKHFIAAVGVPANYGISPSTAMCAGWHPMSLTQGFGSKPTSLFATRISGARCSDATVQKHRCLSQVPICLAPRTWNRTSIVINMGEEFEK